MQYNAVSDKARCMRYAVGDTKEKIEQVMDQLAREYGRTERGDPRRAEIAKQLSELCLMLDRLVATIH